MWKQKGMAYGADHLTMILCIETITHMTRIVLKQAKMHLRNVPTTTITCSVISSSSPSPSSLTASIALTLAEDVPL